MNERVIPAKFTKAKTAAARGATAEKEDVRTLTVKTAAPVPAFLDEVEMTGAGVSTDQDDNLLPMAKVLQKGSPQVDPDQPVYIREAKAGMIYVKNSPNPIIEGANTGFLFQPVAFDKKVIEWLPRNKGGGGGQGYVKAHETMPETCVQKPDPQNPDKLQWVDPKTGNVFVDTRYHVGYLIGEKGEPPMPLCIPFSSTGHSVSRGWMFLQNQKYTPSGKKADSWAVVYRFRTELKSKGQNTWFIFRVTDSGPEIGGVPTTSWVPTLADYERGHALHKALQAGEVKIDTAADATEDPGQGNPDSERM